MTEYESPFESSNSSTFGKQDEDDEIVAKRKKRPRKKSQNKATLSVSELEQKNINTALSAEINDIKEGESEVNDKAQANKSRQLRNRKLRTRPTSDYWNNDSDAVSATQEYVPFTTKQVKLSSNNSNGLRSFLEKDYSDNFIENVSEIEKLKDSINNNDNIHSELRSLQEENTDSAFEKDENKSNFANSFNIGNKEYSDDKNVSGTQEQILKRKKNLKKAQRYKEIRKKNYSSYFEQEEEINTESLPTDRGETVKPLPPTQSKENKLGETFIAQSEVSDFEAVKKTKINVTLNESKSKRAFESKSKVKYGEHAEEKETSNNLPVKARRRSVRQLTAERTFDDTEAAAFNGLQSQAHNSYDDNNSEHSFESEIKTGFGKDEVSIRQDTLEDFSSKTKRRPIKKLSNKSIDAAEATAFSGLQSQVHKNHDNISSELTKSGLQTETRNIKSDLKNEKHSFKSEIKTGFGKDEVSIRQDTLEDFSSKKKTKRRPIKKLSNKSIDAAEATAFSGLQSQVYKNHDNISSELTKSGLQTETRNIKSGFKNEQKHSFESEIKTDFGKDEASIRQDTLEGFSSKTKTKRRPIKQLSNKNIDAAEATAFNGIQSQVHKNHDNISSELTEGGLQTETRNIKSDLKNEKHSFESKSKRAFESEALIGQKDIEGESFSNKPRHSTLKGLAAEANDLDIKSDFVYEKSKKPQYESIKPASDFEAINESSIKDDIGSEISELKENISEQNLKNVRKKALLNQSEDLLNELNDKLSQSEFSGQQEAKKDFSSLSPNVEKAYNKYRSEESRAFNLQNAKYILDSVNKPVEKSASLDDEEAAVDGTTAEAFSEAAAITENLSNSVMKKAFNNKTEYTNKSELAKSIDKGDDEPEKMNNFALRRKKMANALYNDSIGGSAAQAGSKAAASTANKKIAEMAAARVGGRIALAIFSEPHTAAITIGLAILILCLALLVSCAITVGTIGGGVISTTYMTADKDIYDASVYYVKLETDTKAAINKKIRRAQESYEYDEIRYDIDNFEHNPEVLIAYFSAQYPGWDFNDSFIEHFIESFFTDSTPKSVKDLENKIFEQQYTLEEKDYWEWHYPSAKAMFPIRWHVKEFTLVNKGLETVLLDEMDEEVKEYYDLLREYRGNRVWFESPVKYNWESAVINLCGDTVKGTTTHSKLSNVTNLTYTDDGATVSAGTVINLPAEMGSNFSYMGWQTITSPSSNQYKLREQAGMNFDAEGFGIINNRYVVAVTSTFGSVGDYIDVYQSDGTIFPCIIGDIKNQNDFGCNKWGHNLGKVVVEFVVDKSTWYPFHANPGTSSCHPEWGGKTITKIINIGTYQQGEAPPEGGQITDDVVDFTQDSDNLVTEVDFHKGIDIAGASDTPVLAPFDGKVTRKTDDSITFVDTEESFEVKYECIKDISVSNGQEISVGEQLATMSTGEHLFVPHLHVELYCKDENQQYNPYFYFAFGEDEPPQIVIGGSSVNGQMVPGDSDLGNRVVQFALSRCGYTYLWGGGHTESEIRNPNSTRFDCSGLVCWAYCQAGAYIGVQNTKSLSSLGKQISFEQMQAGDIILWSSNGAYSGIHHVAIYIGGGQIVEAPYDGQPISTRPVYDKNLIYTIRRLYD